jgi:hypothetical protein
VYLGKGSSPADLGKDAFWRYLGKGIHTACLGKDIACLGKGLTGLHHGRKKEEVSCSFSRKILIFLF